MLACTSPHNWQSEHPPQEQGQARWLEAKGSDKPMPGVGAELLQSQGRDSGSVSNLQLRIETDPMAQTYSHASDVNSKVIQKRYHMPALGDGALQTRVECITRKKGENIRLACKLYVVPIIVHKGLEAGDTTNWFRRPRSKRFSTTRGFSQWFRTQHDRHH